MPRPKKKPFKRLPNNFGSIKKLSGNRRNPYYVCGPGRRVGNTVIPGEKIGSAASWEEAYEMLVLWRAGKKTSLVSTTSVPETTQSTYTFSEVYEMFFKEKYEDSMKEYSRQSKGSTRAAFRNCKELHGMPFSQIRYKELQENLDSLAIPKEEGGKGLKHASLELVQSLYKEMYAFARKYDITKNEYERYVTIKIPDDDEKGEPFAEDSLKILWENSHIPQIQAALIICYSGWRINEFKNIDIVLSEMVFRGGMKTKAGKGRIVPIHPRIAQFLPSYMANPIKNVQKYRNEFYEALNDLGILYYEKDGKMQKHTPHDCRHTFSWLCDTYNVDALSKRIMIGHSLGKDITDQVYGHRTIEQLRKEILKIE